MVGTMSAIGDGNNQSPNMKTALQLTLLSLVSVGFATAAFAGVTGISPSVASASGDAFILVYTVVGSMLVSLLDYRTHRPIMLRASEAKARRVVPFGASRRTLNDGNRIAA
jgi:hypothetical protein